MGFILRSRANRCIFFTISLHRVSKKVGFQMKVNLNWQNLSFRNQTIVVNVKKNVCHCRIILFSKIFSSLVVQYVCVFFILTKFILQAQIYGIKIILYIYNDIMHKLYLEKFQIIHGVKCKTYTHIHTYMCWIFLYCINTRLVHKNEKHFR